MKLYKTNTIWQEISEVEAEKANDKSVWIKGRRNSRRSSYDNYFDTWQDAYNYLKDVATARLNGAKLNVERAEEILTEIEKLKP